MTSSSQNGLDQEAVQTHRVFPPFQHDFILAMNQGGVRFQGTIIADGRIHRFQTQKVGRKDGWYVFYGLAGAFGDWSQDIHERWSVSNESLPHHERESLSQQIERSQKTALKERERREEEAATYALKTWGQCHESGCSPYLERKRVANFGARLRDTSLIIPLRDIQGKLWSLQWIRSDGNKRFLIGGRKKGCFHLIGDLQNKQPIIITEGYATGASVYEATQTSTVIAFDAGNLESVVRDLKNTYPLSPLIIAGDDDCWGEENVGRRKAEEVAQKYGASVVFPCFKDRTHKPTDFNDLHVLEGPEEVKRQLEPFLKSKHLKSISLSELLAMDIKPRDMVLNPILPEQGLVMIHAPRGIGKTHVSLMIAFIVAIGGQMFQGKWTTRKPNKVLFVDGEMPLVVMQERLARIVHSTDTHENMVDNLQIITPDMQERGISDLSTLKGQQFIEEHLSDVKLLILDNYSALCRQGRENEAESWLPLQEWFLTLRKRGLSVLLIHHSNKNGGQRGTSKKEDLLDTVITLRKPEDYDPKEGAKFEVHYEKARGFFGDDAMPFEATLREEDGKFVWHIQNLEDSQMNRIGELSKEGLTQREIAQETGLSPATINRKLKEVKARDLE